MTPSEFSALRELVKTDEGLRLFVYDDANGIPLTSGCTLHGKATIGFGRNLMGDGISAAEALSLLDNDLQVTVAHLTLVHPVIMGIDPVRMIVLCNMAFNLGVAGIGGFHQLWDAIDRSDWAGAKAAIMDSAAARELPARYQRLANAMETATL